MLIYMWQHDFGCFWYIIDKRSVSMGILTEVHLLNNAIVDYERLNETVLEGTVEH